MIKVRKETLPYAVTIIELSSTPEDVDRQNRSWKSFLFKDPKYEDNGMIKVRKETLPYAVTIIELSSTPEDVDRQNRSWKSGRSNSLCKLKY